MDILLHIAFWLYEGIIYHYLRDIIPSQRIVYFGVFKFQADCLVVHDQLTKVNGVSLTGLSKGPAMNMLHKALQLDGPIYGHIQLVVVRKDLSSVTHVDNANDFVYGPNNQTFRETHHAKYSTTRDISSPESRRPSYFDSGDIMTSNLPINPHINVRQLDYHHASFQHKPMQKSDFRMESNAISQKEVKEIKSVNIRFLSERLITLFSSYTHLVVKEKNISIGFRKL